jgi:hypothetical protein
MRSFNSRFRADHGCFGKSCQGPGSSRWPWTHPSVLNFAWLAHDPEKAWPGRGTGFSEKIMLQQQAEGG